MRDENGNGIPDFYDEFLTGALNGDNLVNGSDLSTLLGLWGDAGGHLNGDDWTDLFELSVLLSNWNDCT